MYRYVMVLRVESEMGDVLEENAWSVEGWNRDYAFFGDPDDRKRLTALVPRDIVLRLYREPAVEQPVPLRNLADEKAHAWFAGLSGEERFKLMPQGPGTADPQKWWENMSASERILAYEYNAVLVGAGGPALPENHDV